MHKLAIIGGGPKGLYGFERLVAWLNTNRSSEKIEIHIFNRTKSFGAGEIFRTEQPGYLLMNNPIGDINMWGVTNPPPLVPQTLTLSQWLFKESGLKISNNDFAARATAGRYLSQGFESIVANLPGKVTVKLCIGEVVDVRRCWGKYSIRLKKTGKAQSRPQSDRYDHILLATGHPTHRETKQTVLYKRFAAEHKKSGFLPYSYPTETVFSRLPPNCSVGLKGIGLTFVDAVLGLTEGKGGLFEKDGETGKLVYKPSGKEPRIIYPFSRSGLPMIPRISVTSDRNELRFFTKSVIQKMQTGEKLDFTSQLWPLIKKDMIQAYTDVVLQNRKCTGDFPSHQTTQDIGTMVDELINPSQENHHTRGQSHNTFVQQLYQYYLHEAQKGELDSPMAAVTAVWRKASSLFCEVYAFGGLSPESQREFDSSFRGKLHRITYGPPVQSAEKLFALMECGILNFDPAQNPDLILDGKTFILQSKPNNIPYPIDYLVDARIPAMNLKNAPGPLYRNMIHRGLLSTFINKSGKEPYQSGGVNITRQGFVIDKKGRMNQGIGVTGTPTEGITFDNETLSRSRNNFVDSWAEYISGEYAKSTK